MSPVLILVLLAIVAVFVFAVMVGSRGGLSASGCLPADDEGRRALLDRWFAPQPLRADEMKLGQCEVAGKLLSIAGTCALELPALPPQPRSWTEKIAAAFRSDRRRLYLTPVQAPLRLFLRRAPSAEGEARDPIESTLRKRTDVTFSPDGVRALTLTCTTTTPCKVDLSPPSEES